MIRLVKNTTNSVTISVIGNNNVSNIANVTIEYKKLNTDSSSTISCVVTDYNCFSGTITIEVICGELGGEYFVSISDDLTSNVIYNGLMYVDNGSLVNGNNGIKIG